MRNLLLLAALLLASVGVFVVRGRDALASRDRAHEELLARERRLDELLRQVGGNGDDFAGQREEHTLVVALASQRLALLEGTGTQAPLPRLAALLSASPAESLRPGGLLHEGLRTQAGLPADSHEAGPDSPSPQELALARIVQVLGNTGAALSVDRLQLRGGELSPVVGVKALRLLEAQVEVSGALPDVLATLEAFAPAEAGGLPALTVKDASVRRIEPSSWGENLHRLATPPVRLAISVDVLLRAPEGS